MATYASRPVLPLQARASVSPRVLVPAGLLLVAGLAVALRTPGLGVGFWIDEGLSVGIADRPAADIPGILRQDGSPPLYYVLLHYWMAVVGRSEAATHALSLVCTVLAIPVAFWAGRRVFGARTGWIAALLVACNPFLTQYAQETRMYTLVALLGFAAAGCWLAAMVAESAPDAGTAVRRGPAIGFAVALALMLWTHNWALFFGAATGVAWLALLALSEGAERTRLQRTGLIGYGGAALLFLPWIPTLLYQAGHTGAPWAKAPTLEQLVSVPANLLGEAGGLTLGLVGGAGLLALLRRPDARWSPAGRAAGALAVIVVLTILFAWLISQVSPAWAGRYLSVAVPPLLLLAAAGLAHAGRLGLVALVLIALMWAADAPPREKSSVRSVAEAIGPSLRPGDIVVATQPETVSVLHYYLPPGLRYASLTGVVPDVGVTDWRDGVERLKATTPERDLRPLMDDLPRGARLVLVVPQVYSTGQWSAPWTSLVRLRSEAWTQYLSNDPRFAKVVVAPPAPLPRRASPVRATVFEKR